jgi:PKD repeat protein
VPVIANFTDTSNNATEWYWLFGDGNTSTVQSPVFTYTIPGSYSVNHSAGNGQYTSWTNKSNYITATQPAPVASFTSNISSGLFNLPVEFTDTSSNSPTSWNWSFGDGVTESIQNPTHVYTTGGNYTVNLTAINDGGSSSAYAYITVYNTTTSTFSGTPTSGIVPLSVTFTDTSSNGTTYYWDFGDGNTSTTKSLTFEYNLTGIYTVNHEVSNGYSTSWTNESNYIIVNQMVAQSSGTPTSGNLPLTVTFLGNSTGSPDTYYWDFGDGNTTSSTVQNPTHVYTTSGMYSVNFSATNASSGAAAWNNLSNYITVTTPPPVANFTSNVTTGLFPLSVGFTDTSSDIPTSWNWSFGDGTVSALQNPSHEFTTGGNYTVNLTATNDGGSSSAYRHVTVYNTTTSGFSANITSGTKPLTVQFTDTSSNATMWYWSFGDGNTSTVQSPEFIYNIPGIYNVNHSASNDYYTSWTNKSNYITVTTPPPVANFTSNVTTGLFPLSVGFTDTSSNTPASWNWSFGDGTVSALQNPSHEFTTGGNYTVNLTATNDGGSNSAYKYITVYNTTTSTFSGTPTSGTVPLSVTFTDTSSNGTTYYWSFGDGNTSTIKSPAFIYNKTGTYNVNHSVSNGQYTSWTNQSGYITINPMVASSSGTPTSGNLPLTVTFLGNSTGSPDTYYWDFGDGNTTSSTVQNPTHVYTTSGMYSVNFSATNTSSGTAAWNNLSEYITVTTPPPVANFTSNITSGLFPLSVGFTDTSSNTPTSWNWDFGDGIVSSLQNPSHIFTTGGNFTVNLTATNSGGSSSAYKYITAYNTTISGFTANITSGNNPLPIAFTVSTPNDNATAWNWSFGDGSYASTQNITHTYISSGIYTVIENASNAYTSNTTTKTGYITVHNATPSANFTGSPISGIIPLIVTFTDTSTVTGGLYWNWSYGDNSYDNFTTSINPSHIYNSIGNFTVSETITNDGGSDTQTRSSYISTAQPVPIANFTTNITSGVFPLSVGFTDTSSNTPISWNWSFGDGTISSVQNNTHVYTTGGNYTVNLTVTNTGGSSSAYAYIIVWNTTTSTFSGTPTSGIVPLSVTFTDTSSNGTAYYWVFGDGNTSTEKSPTFIYNTVGIYSVNHSVSNGQYTSWTNKSDYIINNPMTATATGTPTHGYPSLDVTFNGSATGSPDTYYWNFGDGDTTNNTLQKPVHTYISIGTYSVNFSATNTSSGAIAWNNLSNYITVSGAVPEVKFSAYPLAVYLSSPVQFTDSSTNNPTNWNWSFGNGIYSNEQNPNYTYPNSGMYTITLYVTNIYGSNYTSKINYINVTALPIPTASFTANHTTVIIGNPVQFTDTSSNTPTSWNWSFGDGIYSDTQNPYHIYTSIGTYSVSLTATNAYGSNTITKTNYITVNTNLPVVNFVGAPTVSILGTMVYFTDLSTNTPTSWNWSFGDGNYSTLENPGHIYPDYGVYSVTLTAVNGFGANTSTKSNYITVMIITPTATTIPTPTLAPPSPVSNQSVLITADVGEHYIQWGFASAEPSKKLPPMDIYVDDSSIPAARNYTSTTFLQTINISAAEKHNIAVYNSSAGITNQSEFLAKASVMTLAPTAEIYLFIAIGIIMLVAILILREFIWIVLISIFNIIMSLFGITIAQGHGAMPYVFIGIAIVSGILLLVYGVPKIREELDWF